MTVPDGGVDLLSSAQDIDLEMEELIRFCILQASKNSMFLKSYHLFSPFSIGQSYFDKPSDDHL